MGSETKPTVLDLWVCPDCLAAHYVAGNQASWAAGFAPWCADGCHKRPVRMVRRRALVLDDAAVEDAARVLYDRFGDEVGSLGWAFEEDSFLDEWCEDARAVLGMEESDDD